MYDKICSTLQKQLKKNNMKTIVIKCTEDDLESKINRFILDYKVSEIIYISQVATSLETEDMFAGILTTIIYK